MKPEAFQKWRRERRITQSELAAALGLHPITISKIERGILEFKGTLRTRLRAIIVQGAQAKELLNRKASK